MQIEEHFLDNGVYINYMTTSKEEMALLKNLMAWANISFSVKEIPQKGHHFPGLVAISLSQNGQNNGVSQKVLIDVGKRTKNRPRVKVSGWETYKVNPKDFEKKGTASFVANSTMYSFIYESLS